MNTNLRARAIRFSYLGNLIIVIFFSLAVPVLLTASHASRETLSLFALLPLFWTTRAVIMPAMLSYARMKRWMISPLFILSGLRAAIVVIFLVLAVLLTFMATMTEIRTTLLVTGMLACLLCGIERGILDAGTVLLFSDGNKPDKESFSSYEAAGAIVGMMLSSGFSMELSARFDLRFCCVAMAFLGIILTVPVWRIARAERWTIPADRFLAHKSPLESPLSSERLSDFNNKKTMSVLTLLTLASGGLGLDLCRRVVQPLLLHQGLSLGVVGYITILIEFIIFIIFITIEFITSRSSEQSGRWRNGLGLLLPLVAVSLLLSSSMTGKSEIAVAGFMILQTSYFFFSIFSMNLVIRFGRKLGSAVWAVFMSGISYFVAHIFVAPVLFLTIDDKKGFVATYIVASGCLIFCALTGHFLVRNFESNR